MSEWNHNSHYHNFIIKKLSESRATALDIGSGNGYFASKLSNMFSKVICMEPDMDTYNYAKNKYSTISNMIHKNSILDEFNSEGEIDFISCIASIHHMDFEKSLVKIKDLLSRDGKLVVLGLYKESTLMDYLYTILACIPNKIRCMLSSNPSSEKIIIKTRPANMTFKEIKDIADKILVDYKIKRHLYWRYSIVYSKT